MQGKKQHIEKLFLSFQLSERVSEDNFYRRLKTFLDLQWLYKATKKYYGTEGQQSIDPIVFFKLMLIGYLENIGSDRRIINTAAMRLDMLFFLGYDIDEVLPWHSTLSRTRQLYGEDVFKQLFKEVLKQCIEKGMVSGRRQAVDSVFVKANASMDSLVEKDILDDGDEYASSITEDDATPLKPIDPNTNTKQSNSHTVSAERNKRVQQHHRWKARAYKHQPHGKSITKAIAQGDTETLPKFVSNHTHYSTTDEDARVSTKPGKPRHLNYLGQVSVDTASHIITNIEAHTADKKDSQCLPTVVENTVNNLQAEGLLVEEILADTGYSSGEALKAIEDKNITAYIPNIGTYKPIKESFTYDAQNDQYICTQGAKLPFKNPRTNKMGYTNKEYRSSAKDCSTCPLRSKCIGKSDYKKITVTIDKPYYDRMHQRMQTSKAKRMKKLRSSTVEPVIGTLANYLAMKRVNTRGLQQANKCMLMAAVAYNLKKLLNFRSNKAVSIIKEMELKAKSLAKGLLKFILPTSLPIQKQDYKISITSCCY